jgi:hypothetical protein
MKRIVRLTEKDLTRLVNRIIKESDGNMFATHDLVGGWYDTHNRPVDEPTDYSEEMSFGPEDYDKFMEFINNCDTQWCMKTKKWYKRYADRGDIRVRR